MKIVVLAKACAEHENVGGMAKAATSNYEIFKELGHEVFVITTSIKDKPKEFVKNGINFINVGKPKVYTKEYYTGTREHISKIKPSLIVVNSRAGVGVSDSIPSIFISHGHGFQVFYTTLLSHFALNKLPPSEHLNKLILRHVNTLWTKSRQYLSKFTRCVFLTELAAREIRERLLIPSAIYIPPCVAEIDTGNFERTFDVIICAKDFALSYKGTHQTFKLVKELNCKTVAVGGRLGRDNKRVTDNITFTGYVPACEVYKYMRQSKIILETSYNQSGLNLVKLEALYNGLGLVEWGVGSSYATSIDAYNGYIIPLGDMKELKLKTKLALEQYKEFGKNSREIYDKEFSRSVYKKKWGNLIKEVVEEKNGK